MYINNLIIEVTRRCNMTCEHCLRGDPQNKNISVKVMERFLIDNEIESISSITFTGGEPTLHLKAIEDFMQLCKDHRIDVGSFYIVTNGKKISDRFIRVAMDLYLFCSDNEMSQIEISNSPWHNMQDCRDKEGIERLSTLRFVSERTKMDYKQVISEGRGINLNRNLENARTIEPGDLTLDKEVYLNVNGDICSACDLSFESQEIHKVGNVFSTTLKELIPEEAE